MRDRMHMIHISISTTKWFTSQKEMAEFLDIKNSSKKAINSRCRAFGYALEFDSNDTKHDIKFSEL